MSKYSLLTISLVISTLVHQASAADASAGRKIFAERCSICHTAEPGDNGGAQGPSLIGVYDRRSASGNFAYTTALRGASLHWDASTLDRFLTSPTTVVPGTSMVVAVPETPARDDLIAYLQSVQHVKPVAVERSIPAVTEQSANWRLDAPGVNHHITVESLPPPFATPASNNRTSLVTAPAGAVLAVPKGFKVTPFSSGLAGPRRMVQAPNGDIFVTEVYGGKVSVLRPSADGTAVVSSEAFASGLKQPFGLAFYPDAQHPQWLYVAETHRVIRYPYRVGDIRSRGALEVVVPQLPSGSGHFTRDVAFSADGRHLYVSVGSASNVAENMSKKSGAELNSFTSGHALGAAWDAENDRAAVLEFDAIKPGASKVYATGIRNCVGLTIQPSNGALWCTTNERDNLGDDLVPDYSARVIEGAFYGWPWYYLGAHEDPRLKGERPDLASQVRIPEVLYQAHSAALGMTFYTKNSGKSAFPPEYAGDAIVALHGSWNRSLRTGYKLVRVHMKDGEPSGDYEDFLTGFVVDNDSVWGRPVATVQLKDGSLLMSEDGGNVIFRISYAR